MLKSYIAFDLETTGLDPMNNEIIEIGALKVRDGKVSERFMEFIKPQELISPAITGLTGISNDMVASARPARSVITDFIDFCEEDILIGHNIIFDYSFTKCTAAREGLPFEKMGIDTLKIAKKVHPELESKSLSALCEHYKIENKGSPPPLIWTRLQLPNYIRRSPIILNLTIQRRSNRHSLHIRSGSLSLPHQNSLLFLNV